MAQIAQLSARRVHRIGMFVFLFAIAPAAAAFGADPTPNVSVTPTPLPKIEHQTVGTGPRFLTPMEERKLALQPQAGAPQGGSIRRPDAAPVAAPVAVPSWPSFAADKSPGFMTFVPVPGFAERTLVAKPFVESPSTAVERKAGPGR